MGIVDMDLGDIVGEVGGIIDDLHTSDEEEHQMWLQERQIDASLMLGQNKVNLAQAQHKSAFVAGPRPFIMWVCGFALAYHFIGYPLLTWVWQLAEAFEMIPTEAIPPKAMDLTELWPLIFGLLGLGTMRSVEKTKGVQTNAIRAPIEKAGSWWSRLTK